jgi:hypothetical protein
MTALIVRTLNPLHYALANTAQRLVMWYAGRIWTLWVLLLALPFAALVTGCAVLKQNWTRHNKPMQFARDSLAVASTTFAAGGILAIVILHMLAN